jgi:hypothetical protein
VPVEFDRDDANRRLKMTVTDPITLSELIASAERQLAEGAWSYGTLIDARGIVVALPPDDIRSLVTHVRELVATHGPRGPIACVARQAKAIASVQIYMLFGGKTDALEVFWDLAEAREWLDEADGATRL